MKRLVIVIVAGMVFGVTAAYAATSHSNSGKAPSVHPAPAATFATQAGLGGSSTSTGGADDPVTHDQADDHGQAGSSTSDTGGATGRSDDSQADDRADDSQGDDSKGDDSQNGSGQGGGSQSGGGSDDSGGSGSGGDGGGD
jgi:hypothetical protein